MNEKRGFLGLMTSVSELIAPEGALRKADNVVIRSPGAIEPRPAFSPVVALSQGQIRDAVDHGGTMVYLTSTGWTNGGSVRQARLQPIDNPIVLSRLRLDTFPRVVVRGNLYLAHAKGVAKSCNATDILWRQAGIGIQPITIAFVSPSLLTGGNLAPSSKWSYRVVPRVTDENGVIVYGVPSGAVEGTSSSGPGPSQVVVASQGINHLSNYDGSGNKSAMDTVEIYRTTTFAAAITADDAMQVVHSFQVVGVGITFNGGTNDNVADSARGKAIYTAPARGGFAVAADKPPAAGVIGTYRGSVFYGDIIGSQRLTASYRYANQTGVATGAGYRTATATHNTGTNQLTLVSVTTGIKIGQAVFIGNDTSSYIVTGVAGTTVTLNTNPSTSGVGTAVVFADAIWVNGIQCPLTHHVYGVGQGVMEYYIRQSNAGPVSVVRNDVTPAEEGRTNTVVFESYTRNATALSVFATNGADFYPPIAEYGTATGTASKQDASPGYIAWTNTDEPEHVPVLNYAPVGDKLKRVLGFATSRDGYYIFKEDGIWRLWGVRGTWQLDPYDLTTRVVLPSSIQEVNNKIFALTNKGVVVIEDGAQPVVVSNAIAPDINRLIDDCIANRTSVGYYKLSGFDGNAATVNARDNEYLLAVGSNELDVGGNILVYNDNTGAWTTWSVRSDGPGGGTITGLGKNERGLPTIFLTTDTAGTPYEVWQLSNAEVSTLGEPRGRVLADGFYSKTINGVTSNTTQVAPGVNVVTVTFSAAHEAIAGNVLAQLGSNGSWYIYDVPTTTTARVIVWDGETRPAVGAADIYGAITSTIQLQGLSQPVLDGKVWSSLQVAFSRLLGPVYLAAQFSGSEDSRRELTQARTDVLRFARSSGMANSHLGDLLAHPVPGELSRSWLLRVGLTWTAFRGRVVLDALRVTGRSTAPGKSQVHGQ
jgi:hypothetical protein